MGLQIGKVTGYEIKENRDSTEKVLLLQVEVTDAEDIQTIEWYQSAGLDSNPPLNSLVVFSRAGQAWPIALGANDNIEPESDPGEHKIYSSAGGVIKAFLKLFNTGLSRLESLVTELFSTGNTKIEAGGKLELIGNVIEINGNTDNAVRFSVLEAAFNQLKNDFNSHSGHGIGSTPTPSTADISGAKIDDIKTS